MKFPKIRFNRRSKAVVIDGRTYSLASDQGRSDARQALTNAHKRADEDVPVDAEEIKTSLEVAIEALQQAQETLLENAEEAVAVDAEEEEKTTDADEEENTDEDEENPKEDPKTDAKVARIVALLERAKTVAPSIKVDSYTERNILTAALKARGSKNKLDAKQSIETLRALFNELSDSPNETTIKTSFDSLRTNDTPRNDSAGRMDADDFARQLRAEARNGKDS